MKYSRLGTQKLEKIEKVTGSQDDGFVGGLRGLKYSRLDTQKHEKLEKVTGSQDDGFVGGWRGLKYSRLDTQKHEKLEKVTGCQDDGFAGGLRGLKYSRLDTQKHEKIEKVTGSQRAFGGVTFRPSKSQAQLIQLAFASTSSQNACLKANTFACETTLHFSVRSWLGRSLV